MAELDTYERQLRYWGADTQLGRGPGSGVLRLLISCIIHKSGPPLMSDPLRSVIAIFILLFTEND